MAWRKTIELLLTQWEYNCKKGEKQMFAEMFWLEILSLSLECHGDLMNWFLNILLLVSIDRLYNENQLILSSAIRWSWMTLSLKTSIWSPPWENSFVFKHQSFPWETEVFSFFETSTFYVFLKLSRKSVLDLKPK